MCYVLFVVLLTHQEEILVSSRIDNIYIAPLHSSTCRYLECMWRLKALENTNTSIWRRNLSVLLVCVDPQAATDRAWTADTARGTAWGWRRTASLTTALSAAAHWSTPTSLPARTTWSHSNSMWVAGPRGLKHIISVSDSVSVKSQTLIITAPRRSLCLTERRHHPHHREASRRDLDGEAQQQNGLL